VWAGVGRLDVEQPRDERQRLGVHLAHLGTKSLSRPSDSLADAHNRCVLDAARLTVGCLVQDGSQLMQTDRD
jgi:hypothetical protein